MSSPTPIQVIQTAHRWNIANAWTLNSGSRVLEIGCGQGDMTAVLAEAVGPSGHVTAVDVAPRDYGSPISVGEATDLIKASDVGSRIDFQFEFDLERNELLPDSFEYAILAHSSWYFASRSELAETFSRLRRWAKRLCFAEWDLTPTSLDQLPHLLAVLIQAWQSDGQANVRTPASRETVLGILEETGWVVERESWLDTSELQDADWEIDIVLRSDVTKSVEEQIALLRSIAKAKGNVPLPAYALVAGRT